MNTISFGGRNGNVRAPAAAARLESSRGAGPAIDSAPKGSACVLEAEHLCMSLRGVQKPGASTITSALHGLVRDDPRTREEFLTLTGGRGR